MQSAIAAAAGLPCGFRRKCDAIRTLFAPRQSRVRVSLDEDQPARIAQIFRMRRLEKVLTDNRQLELAADAPPEPRVAGGICRDMLGRQVRSPHDNRNPAESVWINRPPSEPLPGAGDWTPRSRAPCRHPPSAALVPNSCAEKNRNLQRAKNLSGRHSGATSTPFV